MIRVIRTDNEIESDAAWRETVNHLTDLSALTSDGAIATILVSVTRMCFFTFLDWPNRLNNANEVFDLERATRNLTIRVSGEHAKKIERSSALRWLRVVSTKRNTANNSDSDTKSSNRARESRLYVNSQALLRLLEELSRCDLRVRGNGKLVAHNGSEALKRDFDAMYASLEIIRDCVFANVRFEVKEYAETEMNEDDMDETAATVAFAFLSLARYNGNSFDSQTTVESQLPLIFDPSMREYDVFAQHAMYRLSRAKMSQIQTERFVQFLVSM